MATEVGRKGTLSAGRLFLGLLCLALFLAGIAFLFLRGSSDPFGVLMAIFMGGFGLLFLFVVVFRWERLVGFNFGKDKKGRVLGWPGDRW